MTDQERIAALEARVAALEGWIATMRQMGVTSPPLNPPLRDCNCGRTGPCDNPACPRWPEYRA